MAVHLLYADNEFPTCRGKIFCAPILFMQSIIAW